MGTIITRKRSDGSIGYMAQVRVKQKGKVVHAETKTFDRKQAANAWVSRRETELRQPGALDRLKVADPRLPTSSTGTLTSRSNRSAKPKPRSCGPLRPTTLHPYGAVRSPAPKSSPSFNRFL